MLINTELPFKKLHPVPQLQPESAKNKTTVGKGAKRYRVPKEHV